MMHKINTILLCKHLGCHIRLLLWLVLLQRLVELLLLGLILDELLLLGLILDDLLLMGLSLAIWLPRLLWP
jgi:hypothetical protein